MSCEGNAQANASSSSIGALCLAGADRASADGVDPHANGGELLAPLSLPDFHAYALRSLSRCD